MECAVRMKQQDVFDLSKCSSITGQINSGAAVIICVITADFSCQGRLFEAAITGRTAKRKQMFDFLGNTLTPLFLFCFLKVQI